MADEDADRDVMAIAQRRGGAKAVRAPKRAWTQERRACFLDTLAATANVRMAAAATGMGCQGVYQLRARDAAFAGLWDAALDQGYARLESELLSTALGEREDRRVAGAINAIDPDGDRAAAGPIDQELALRMLALKRSDGARRTLQNRSYKLVPIADVEAALAKQLAIVEKRLARTAAQTGEREAAA